MMWKIQMMKIKKLRTQSVKWLSMLMSPKKISNIRHIKRKIKKRTIQLSNLSHNLIQLLEEKIKNLKNKIKINPIPLPIKSQKSIVKFQMNHNKMSKIKLYNNNMKTKKIEIKKITEEMNQETIKVWKKVTNNTNNSPEKRKLIQELSSVLTVLPTQFGEKD